MSGKGIAVCFMSYTTLYYTSVKLRFYLCPLNNKKTIRVTEASATGQSIFQYAPAGKAATAYMNLTMEVLGFEKQRTKGHAAPIR